MVLFSKSFGKLPPGSHGKDGNWHALGVGSSDSVRNGSKMKGRGGGTWGSHTSKEEEKLRTRADQRRPNDHATHESAGRAQQDALPDHASPKKPKRRKGGGKGKGGTGRLSSDEFVERGWEGPGAGILLRRSSCRRREGHAKPIKRKGEGGGGDRSNGLAREGQLPFLVRKEIKREQPLSHPSREFQNKRTGLQGNPARPAPGNKAYRQAEKKMEEEKKSSPFNLKIPRETGGPLPVGGRTHGIGRAADMNPQPQTTRKKERRMKRSKPRGS